VGFEDTLREISFTLVRFTAFACGAILFGLVPTTLLVLRPSFSSLEGTSWDRGRGRVAVRLEGFVQAALVGATVAAALGVLLQAILVADFGTGEVSVSSFDSVLSTSFGRWYALRFPLLAALAILLVGKVRTSVFAGAGDGRRAPAPLWWGLWTALALMLLATSTFSGHSAVAQPRTVALINDILHLAAGGAWFAGIVVLAVVLPDGWRQARGEALDLLAPSVVRFSKLALVAIALVAATGTINSFLHVGAIGDLAGTGYGRALLAKIASFSIVLALGGFNHYVLRERMARRTRADAVGAGRLFRRTIAVELAVGLLLFGLTGVLTGQVRTRESTAPAGYSQSATF